MKLLLSMKSIFLICLMCFSSHAASSSDDEILRDLTYLLEPPRDITLESRREFNGRSKQIKSILKTLKKGRILMISGQNCNLTPLVSSGQAHMSVNCKDKDGQDQKSTITFIVTIDTGNNFAVSKKLMKKYGTPEKWAVFIDDHMRQQAGEIEQTRFTGKLILIPYVIPFDKDSEAVDSSYYCEFGTCQGNLHIGAKILNLEVYKGQAFPSK
jgi:hypothetical protein